MHSHGIILNILRRKCVKMKWSVNTIVTVIALLSSNIKGFAIIYIPPTEPANTPCPSSQNVCFTLNEWIESRTHLFTNGTTVMLLSGIHFINSTLDSLLIKHVSHIVFTGHPHEQTTVECNYKSRFGFGFYDAKEVNISNIQFRFCALLYNISGVDIFFTLAFYKSQNITIANVKIIQGSNLTVIDSSEGSIFLIHNSMLTSGFFFLSSFKNNTEQPEKVQFVDSSCSSFVIAATHYYFELSMLRTSIQNISSRCNDTTFIIKSISRVSFTDVTFWNNSAPLKLESIRLIELRGHILFSRNSEGVALYNCAYLDIYRNATIEFLNNNVSEYVLHLCNIPVRKIEVSVGIGEDGITVLAFVNNTVRNGGVMILDFTSPDSSPTSVMQLSNTQLIFQNNTCQITSESSRAAILLLINAALDIIESNTTFIHNYSPLSGGITLISSRFAIAASNVNFENNHGTDGGGLALYERSTINCLIGMCNLYFAHNMAIKRGGAIFVKDSDYVNSLRTSYDSLRMTGLGEFVLIFSSNTADLAGDDIYGGWIDSLPNSNSHQLITIFQNNSLDTVTSNPTRVCMCSNSNPVCNFTEYGLNLSPGQTFEIEVVAVGQRIGTVPSIVSILESPDKGSLTAGQEVQSVGRQCTTLQFTVSTLRPTCELKLRVQDSDVPEISRLLKKLPPRYHILLQQFNIKITLKPCPLGYKINQSSKKCLCSNVIDSHSGVGCNLKTYSITRDKHHWIHATSYSNNQYNGQTIVIHDHCAYDYCQDDTDSLTFHLETPDKQCAFGRSGILCGACQANLSQVFGTSKCKECSSFMVFAIVPVTIVAGILLVGFLMVLNFTVSTGTINGLIFYANIVRANQAVFFPARITTSFLSIFIAWLNLDIGIEVCFYNGLDAYTKTWLQFIFPFYIWLIVIAIIISCYYSTMASKLFGKNPVQVLATLFLLSYAKIIRVVITVFSYTVLIYSDGFSKKVWLYDGNVEFLSGKHTVLFFVAFLIFVLLTVPYTVTLVSIQWLQQFSHYRPLFWVHRLMPLFDAYTGPYKLKHRYWTGLLLLVRVIFLPIFSTNFTNNPAINLLAVKVMSSIILTYLSFIGGIYKSTLNNILELASVLNLLLLSSATLYVLYTGYSRTTTTYVSTGSAFIIFIILILYHVGQQLMTLKRVKKCKSLLLSCCIKRKNVGDRGKNLTDTSVRVDKTVIPTSTELCRPLIDY